MNTKKIIKSIIVAGFLSLLFACSSDVSKSIVVQRNDVVLLPRPNSIKLDRVEFGTTTIDGKVYFTLTASNYQNLSININKIITYSKNSTSVIEKYEEMVETTNKN